MTVTSALIDATKRSASCIQMPQRYDGLVDAVVPGGARDELSTKAVLDILPTLPNWPPPGRQGHSAKVLSNARAILEFLATYPGAGWQQRWVASGADSGAQWLESLEGIDTPHGKTLRRDLVEALPRLLLCRIVFPSYDFLTSYRALTLYSTVRQVFRPDLFAVIESRLDAAVGNTVTARQALIVISKVVLHTGRDVNELTGDDLLTYRAWRYRKGRGDEARGSNLAWTALHGIADLGEHSTMRDALRPGQRPTHELVDAYQIRSPSVREVLVRYLDERRPALDYTSFQSLVSILAGVFWSDIERHHPDLGTLNLPIDVAQAWKERIRTVSTPDGRTRLREDPLSVLICVRGFYRDLQEWALQDPAWVQWSFPNPIRRADTVGYAKAKRRRTARIHQRVREQLSHLPALVEAAERHRVEQAALLAATNAASFGGPFEHSGRQYRRIEWHGARKGGVNRHPKPANRIEDLSSGEVIDIGRAEHEAFWAWAVIETLRHTGVRVEELLEMTHLGLVSYKLPKTGEVVPMLQIVPSKTNEERLLLVSPELASVLATIISRLRADNNGMVPLTRRYDRYEKETGPALPHLFQHRSGWKWMVPAPTTVQRWLTQTLERAGLTDSAGNALHYTPHDFRRMFATEAVAGGLPIHIAAKILGHKDINTTQGYTAVFDEGLVRTYRAFLDARRALRPEAEYREPTQPEWDEFQQHFELRKVELGTCSRPYGTPCKHEHACVRCPMLRVDPKQHSRLVEIIRNLDDRITEARLNGWLGEVQGLQTSRDAAANKLVALDRTVAQAGRAAAEPALLGIPVVAGASPMISNHRAGDKK
jgi:site-specific recombinase XerD